MTSRIEWTAIACMGIAAGLVLTGCASGAAIDEADTTPTDVASDASQDQYLSDFRSAMSDFFAVPGAPVVPVRAWVLPEEADEVRSACIAEAGYPMAFDGSFSYPDGQLEAFNRTQYECWTSYPVMMEYSGALGDEQIRAQYRWTVDWLIPCLEREGLTITDVPSEGAFVDTWSTEAFWPYAQVIPVVSYEDYVRLRRECPQHAPAAVLWDGAPVTDYPVPLPTE